MTNAQKPLTASPAELDKWESEWDYGPEWATYPGRRLIATIRARDAELTALRAVAEAAHFLFAWTFQADIISDPIDRKWRITDLHPGVWNKLNSAERDLWNALTAAGYPKEDNDAPTTPTLS